jgi:hypothetical protein
MKYLAILTFVVSTGSLVAQSAFDREYQQLTDQRNKALAAASEPINRRYKADLGVLLRKATQGNDLPTAVKIKEAITKLEGASPALGSSNKPSGSWRFTINGRDYVRTFHEDGTITGEGITGTGKWRSSGGKIVVTYPNGHETKLDLPLNPKGAKAEGDGGDKQIAVRVGE